MDDSYNASPASVQAALELIGGFPGRHVAVLGEMKELGSGHDEGHRIAGEAAARGAELVVVVDGGPGGPAHGIVEGAAAIGEADVIAVTDRDAALEVLTERLRPGDVVLVKASRGVELDRLVDALVARLGGADGRRPMTLEIIQGLLLAFALVVILMPPYIRFLRHLGFGKRIRVEGPEGHHVKEGTPTMGGLLVILVVLGLYVLLHGVPERGIVAPLAALGIVGFLGAVDDYLNARTGEGIRARQKLIWQSVFGVFFAWQIQQTYGLTGFSVPVLGDVFVDPIVWVALSAFAIVAASNGVNLTDGLDGLAGGTLVFSFVAFLIIALLNVVPLADGTTGNQPQVAVLCALLIGGLLGFLWFNVHPAQIFMGDSGALAFGATLAVIAMVTGQLFVLPLIGLIFVVETLSVIIQIGYFKLSGGKRVFRMAPLHHHFELGGWDEEKITLRFWIVAVLAGLLGVTLFLASLPDFQLTA